MPNIKSAKKRVNTIKTKSDENAMVKTAYKTAIKINWIKKTRRTAFHHVFRIVYSV